MKIVLSAVLALFLVACSEDAPKESVQTEVTPAVTQEAKPEMVKTVEEIKEEVAKDVKEVAKEVESTATEVVKEASAAATEVLKDAKVAVVAAVAEVKKEVAKVSEVTKVTDTAAKATSSNGAVIYKLCSGCHGVNAEKAALGKSQVIKGWSAEKVESALNGYKDGSYGGTMKGLMTGQASKLSPEDIKAVSEHISKL